MELEMHVHSVSINEVEGQEDEASVTASINGTSISFKTSVADAETLKSGGDYVCAVSIKPAVSPNESQTSTSGGTTIDWHNW